MDPLVQEEAKKLLGYNVKRLNDVRMMCETNGVKEVVGELNRNVTINRFQSLQIDKPADWVRLRKGMRAAQIDNQAQQTYRVQVPEKEGESESTTATDSKPRRGR